MIGGNYDAWKLRAPEDERWFYQEPEEEPEPELEDMDEWDWLEKWAIEDLALPHQLSRGDR